MSKFILDTYKTHFPPFILQRNELIEKKEQIEQFIVNNFGRSKFSTYSYDFIYLLEKELLRSTKINEIIVTLSRSLEKNRYKIIAIDGDSLLSISFKMILLADFGPNPGSLENCLINSSISMILLSI